VRAEAKELDSGGLTAPRPLSNARHSWWREVRFILVKTLLKWCWTVSDGRGWQVSHKKVSAHTRGQRQRKRCQRARVPGRVDVLDSVQGVLIPKMAGDDVSKPKPTRLLGGNFALAERGHRPSQ
jgi:hypothetical protein